MIAAPPASTMVKPRTQVATDSSPEEVERYGARGYGMCPQMPRQQGGRRLLDRGIELPMGNGRVYIGCGGMEINTGRGYTLSLAEGGRMEKLSLVIEGMS